MMEEIELSEIHVHHQEKVLYNEVLRDKVNSKLKKLNVKITQRSAFDGSKVFNLDIRGVKHKFHLQLNFTPQDLCFMRFEEFQENVKEPSCFSCLNRNFYPSLVYSRLLLLLYSDSGDGDEAKCIKVPLLQRGNNNAATSLRKLCHVVHSFVSSKDELKHWLVYVVSCPGLDPGDYVFLSITKHALVIILQYHILHYHAFYSSQFSIQTFPDTQQIEIVVTDKAEQIHPNSTMMLPKKFIFKSSHWSSIDKTLKSIQRQSMLNPPKPTAHFNIVHSEMSASGFIPGTTSDNVAILPHYNFDNNNSSSGAMDYIHPTSSKALNTEGPAPHINHWTSGSNGHLPSNHRQSLEDEENPFMRHSEINRPHNIPLVPELIVTNTNEDVPSPHRLGRAGQESDPNPADHKLAMRRSPSCGGLQVFDNLGFDPELVDLNSNTQGFGISENDEDDLPPPKPCSASPHPHGQFFAYKPPPPIPDDTGVNVVRLRMPQYRSFFSLTDIEIVEHVYVNVEQYQLLRNNVHDDSPYYRFYYNFGFVRMAVRMSKKIKRRQRLSKELKQIDFNKLENHELWFDQGFKMRDKDLRFCRLSRSNIQVEDQSAYSNVRGEDQSGYSSVKREDSVPDDPYWNSSLCLTIQSMLQEHLSSSRVSDEIQREFDLSHEQLAVIQVLLSLVPSEKNWKDLAEYIGLDTQDVSIIEHYCYTYRELTARVVLYHWIQLHHQKKVELPSNWATLLCFIEEIDRQDIKNVMQSLRDNEHIQKKEEVLQPWSRLNVVIVEKNEQLNDEHCSAVESEIEEEFVTHL